MNNKYLTTGWVITERNLGSCTLTRHVANGAGECEGNGVSHVLSLTPLDLFYDILLRTDLKRILAY